MNLRILLSGLPILVFLVLSRAAPPWVSISGGFAVSTLVLLYTRRHRLIGVLTLFGFSVVAMSAVVGLIWSSEKAYLASGPASDFLFVPVYFASIVMRQPLVGGIARELIPAVAGRLHPGASVFVRLSIAWAAYELVHGLVRWWMLANLSVGEYIVWSRLIGWPVSAVMLSVTALVIYRAARRLEEAPSSPALAPSTA